MTRNDFTVIIEAVFKGKIMAKTKANEAAKLAHDKFLKRMGCLPEQIKSRKAKSKVKATLGFEGTADTYFEQKPLVEALQGPPDMCQKHDIISNLYKQTPQDQARIKQMANQVGIPVNKGGYQYITQGTDLKTLGRK